MCPSGYFSGEGWWWWPAAEMPVKSVFPNDMGGPGWVLGEIPPEFGGGRRGQSVQGWKIHVCCHPEAVEGLFQALSRLLSGVAHKFAPFPIYSQQRTGFTAYRQIGTQLGDSAAGKACVIYPSTPTQIRDLVPRIDHAISQMNIALTRPVRGQRGQGIRPFPGGVKGDLALGRLGFVYTRYGAFQGDLARSEQVYDPIHHTTCADPRFSKPFPDFIKSVPAEIFAVRRG